MADHGYCSVPDMALYNLRLEGLTGLTARKGGGAVVSLEELASFLSGSKSQEKDDTEDCHLPGSPSYSLGSSSRNPHHCPVSDP